MKKKLAKSEHKNSELYSSSRKLKQAALLELFSNYKTNKIIIKEMKMIPSAVSMAIKRFITYGWINKDRTLTDRGLQIVNLTHSSSKLVNSIEQDDIRGHAFVFVLKKPNIKNWNLFKKYLEIKNIKFEKISPTIEGERIIVNNKIIWRTRKGFVIYMGKNQSYIGKDAYESFYKVLLEVFDIIHKIERIMNISLKGVNGYQLRCSRGHFSLMKNALAQQYNKEKKKLYVYDTKGMWFVIDDSFHLNEAEIVRPDKDITTTIQDHFNYLKENPDILIETEKRINKLSENQANLTLLLEQINDNIIKIARKINGH